MVEFVKEQASERAGERASRPRPIKGIKEGIRPTKAFPPHPVPEARAPFAAIFSTRAELRICEGGEDNRSPEMRARARNEHAFWVFAS